jgi:hypothetical protein
MIISFSQQTGMVEDEKVKSITLLDILYNHLIKNTELELNEFLTYNIMKIMN